MNEEGFLRLIEQLIDAKIKVDQACSIEHARFSFEAHERLRLARKEFLESLVAAK